MKAKSVRLCEKGHSKAGGVVGELTNLCVAPNCPPHNMISILSRSNKVLIVQIPLSFPTEDSSHDWTGELNTHETTHICFDKLKGKQE